MFYYITSAIDENSETDLTMFRNAFPDIKKLGEFGRHKSKYGPEAAMPLFKKITYHWARHSVNPIGDILGGSYFSVRAAELIRAFRGEYDLFEPIDIEGTPAYDITPKTIPDVSDDLDIFYSCIHRRAIIVSERLKDAWNAAGFLGAEFEPVALGPCE